MPKTERRQCRRTSGIPGTLADVARPLRVVGTWEIAQKLGVTTQRADQLTRRNDFPRPAQTLHMGRIWRESEVDRWIERNPRPSSRRGAR